MVEGAAGNAPLLWLVNPSRANRDRRQGLINQPLKCWKNHNIGFERGLEEWRKLLKTGGHVAVSEATWFTDDCPTEIENFWRDGYPGIDTIANKVLQMQKAGYIPIATFVLPENCWLDLKQAKGFC